MIHYVSSKPFYILTGVPNSMGFMYCANTVGEQIIAPDTYGIEEFDTEQELAARVDELIGEADWYWDCANRIPSPPNPNFWDHEYCLDRIPD